MVSCKAVKTVEMENKHLALVVSVLKGKFMAPIFERN